MVFVKNYLFIEFFEYDFVNSYIVKLYNIKISINLLCVYIGHPYLIAITL